MARLLLRSFVRGAAACHFATPVIRALRPEPPHSHDFVEVFWIGAGQGWHWINGARRALAAGVMVFMRAADRHAFSTASRGGELRMVNIAFAQRRWRQLRERYGLMDVFDPKRDDPLELRLSAAQLATAESIASELRVGRLDPVAVDRFLLNLVHLVEVEADPAAAGVAAPGWLRKILAEMSNPMQANPPTTTQELGIRADCTAEHVARTFRRCLGRTPTEVLNDAKLARAAARLAGTSEGILSIALDSGFGNLSHFYKLFRDRYGTTPRRYRIGQQGIV